MCFRSSRQTRADVLKAVQSVKGNPKGTALERAAFAREKNMSSYSRLCAVRVPKRTRLVKTPPPPPSPPPFKGKELGFITVQYMTGKPVLHSFQIFEGTGIEALFRAVASKLDISMSRVRLFCGRHEIQPSDRPRFSLKTEGELDQRMFSRGADGQLAVTLTCVVDKAMLGTFASPFSSGTDPPRISGMLLYRAKTLLLSSSKGNVTFACGPKEEAPVPRRFRPAFAGPAQFYDETNNLYLIKNGHSLFLTDGRQALRTIRVGFASTAFCAANGRIFVSKGDRRIRVLDYHDPHTSTSTVAVGPLKTGVNLLRAVENFVFAATAYGHHVYVIGNHPDKKPRLLRRLRSIQLSDFSHKTYQPSLNKHAHQGMCVSRDARTVVTRTPHEHTLVVRNVSDGKVAAVLRTPEADPIQHLDPHPFDIRLLALTTTGKVAVWREPWKEAAKADEVHAPACMCPCPVLEEARPLSLTSMDGGRTAMVYTDGRLHIMEIKI